MSLSGCNLFWPLVAFPIILPLSISANNCSLLSHALTTFVFTAVLRQAYFHCYLYSPRLHHFLFCQPNWSFHSHGFQSPLPACIIVHVLDAYSNYTSYDTFHNSFLQFCTLLIWTAHAYKHIEGIVSNSRVYFTNHIPTNTVGLGPEPLRLRRILDMVSSFLLTVLTL